MPERWKALLRRKDTETVWEEITRLAEDLEADQLAALAEDLRGWPGQRSMPERWWQEMRRGEHRLRHALADRYLLWYPGIALDPDDDDPEIPEDEPWLEMGVKTAALSSDLRWLVLAAELEGHRAGGDIGLWDADAGAWQPMLSSALDEWYGEAHDARFSPDGSLVAIGLDTEDPVRVAVWRTSDAALLWSAGPGRDAEGVDDTDPWRFDPERATSVASQIQTHPAYLQHRRRAGCDAGMTNTHTPAPNRVASSPPRRSPGIRRLRRTIALALVRGAAHATGAGLVGLLFWWITHR